MKNKVMNMVKGVGLKLEGAALMVVRFGVQLPTRVVGAAACAVSDITDEAIKGWAYSHSLRELKEAMTDDQLVEFINLFVKKEAKEP